MLGAAAAGGTAPSLGEPRCAGASASRQRRSGEPGPGGMEAEEVDPIAEADVYMAYGRDAQAEEILKEALQKDANRIPVHAKLLEIYAQRKDTQAFEQTALKLKSLTNGAGPEWDKAAALGRSIDPRQRPLRRRRRRARWPRLRRGSACGAAAAAPTLDFDLGGARQAPDRPRPDISLDAAPKTPRPPASTSISARRSTPKHRGRNDDRRSPDATRRAAHRLQPRPRQPTREAGTGAPRRRGGRVGADGGGLDFDLNLDLGDSRDGEPKSDARRGRPFVDQPRPRRSAGAPAAPTASTDPKWQEVATKLDLAKAYEEMGDKDGARELLSEVMKDGDAAQKGQRASSCSPSSAKLRQFPASL